MPAGTLSSQDLLPLAKQGNAAAIVLLINQILRPKGIVAKADLQGACLHMKLEGKQIPDPEFLAAFIQLGLLKLDPEPVESVVIYGYERGMIHPAWKQKIRLRESLTPMKVDLPVEASPNQMGAVGVMGLTLDLPESSKGDQGKQPRVRKAVQTANRQVFIQQFTAGLLIAVLGIFVTTSVITLLDSAERGKFLKKSRNVTELPMR